MVYNLDGDFPNLPRRHNQTQRTQPVGTNTTRSPTVAATPATAVTLDSLSQLREEMKTEFMKLIKTEVQTQIHKEMAVIQADVANLSVKLDTMQDGIRDSIGAVVRESIQASFHQQAQQPSYQQQQYLNQAALQPPAHTLHSTQNNYSSPASAMNYTTPNYYAALEPTGPTHDTTMQRTPVDFNTMATPDNAQQQTTQGTSPMETGAQQS
jgi:hypothetical protein